MWGRKGTARLFRGQIEQKAAKLAAFIGKDEFLKELKVKWFPFVKKNSNTEDEVKKARERISESGAFKKTFDIVGITDEDIRQVIEEIQREKPEQESLEVGSRTGRNEPCPCGSGKKYKKCCGGKALEIEMEGEK